VRSPTNPRRPNHDRTVAKRLGSFVFFDTGRATFISGAVVAVAFVVSATLALVVVVVVGGTVRSGMATGEPSERVVRGASGSSAMVVVRRGEVGSTGNRGSTITPESVDGLGRPAGEFGSTVGSAFVDELVGGDEPDSAGDALVADSGFPDSAPITLVEIVVEIMGGTPIAVDVVVDVFAPRRGRVVEPSADEIEGVAVVEDVAVVGEADVVVVVSVGAVETDKAVVSAVVDNVTVVGAEELVSVFGGGEAEVEGVDLAGVDVSAAGALVVVTMEVVVETMEVVVETTEVVVGVATDVRLVVGCFGAVIANLWVPEALRLSTPTAVQRSVYVPAGNAGTSRKASFSVAPRCALSVVITSVPRERLVPNRATGSANWNTTRNGADSKVEPSTSDDSTRTGVAACADDTNPSVPSVTSVTSVPSITRAVASTRARVDRSERSVVRISSIVVSLSVFFPRTEGD
jgi:hypothetical protein